MSLIGSTTLYNHLERKRVYTLWPLITFHLNCDDETWNDNLLRSQLLNGLDNPWSNPWINPIVKISLRSWRCPKRATCLKHFQNGAFQVLVMSKSEILWVRLQHVVWSSIELPFINIWKALITSCKDKPSDKEVGSGKWGHYNPDQIGSKAKEKEERKRNSQFVCRFNVAMSVASLNQLL